MARIAINDAWLRNVDAPEKGQRSYWDTTLKSFGVRVSQAGSKTFVLNKDNTLITIGRFGILSLSEARTEAKRILAERTLGKVRPQSITFPEAVKLFVEDKKRSRRATTADQYEWFLGRLKFTCQLSQITPPELARKLAKIKSKSTYDHVLVAARIMFNWAHKRRYVTENPTFGLTVHGTPQRARVLTDHELKSIWQACDPSKDAPLNGGEKLPATFCTIVRLLILTGQRRGEIAALRKECIQGDLCTLPEDLTKNGLEHTFPLGAIARTLLEQHKSTHASLLFPARGRDSTFNGWSKSKRLLDSCSGVTNWTLHDLRRTYRTTLGKIGVPPHIGERLVNHISAQSDMERVYDRHKYIPDMRKAAEAYEAHIRQVIALPHT